MHYGFFILPCSEVQRRTATVLLAGMDAAVQSETGSGVWGAGLTVLTSSSVPHAWPNPPHPTPLLGKTFSFLVPTLARLVYPPEVFAEDLRGPQAIIVVPTMELGVQVCAVYAFFPSPLQHVHFSNTAHVLLCSALGVGRAALMHAHFRTSALLG